MKQFGDIVASVEVLERFATLVCANAGSRPSDQGCKIVAWLGTK
ncbi:MAG: hypothetical protein WA418_16845 [Bradyrhizobium sp.]